MHCDWENALDLWREGTQVVRSQRRRLDQLKSFNKVTYFQNSTFTWERVRKGRERWLFSSSCLFTNSSRLFSCLFTNSWVCSGATHPANGHHDAHHHGDSNAALHGHLWWHCTWWSWCWMVLFCIKNASMGKFRACQNKFAKAWKMR